MEIELEPTESERTRPERTEPQRTREARECVVVRAGGYDGRQGGAFAAGISMQTAGARALCLHRLRLPPGTRGRPHIHRGHESATYIAAGAVEVWHGPGLAFHLVLTAGDYIYIPPDTPHLPVNSGPDEQEGVHLIELPAHLTDSVGPIPVAAPA
ncbi:cupin domain-containing protein [Streptomyces adelaidensis]|uniref:cupin domain-containing protein n=1 Tax=Streptomyces adelaidensis TaxID=2796465 RepID=UPI0019073770|nr:cupin domain-containing protein [Streptomyces adelaidensis]